MSTHILNYGPFDWAGMALIAGIPGIIFGAGLGAILWRRHSVWGALLGAAAGLVLWDAGVVAWLDSPWS
jgi:hypothetical protein